jgi:glutamyl-tRNA(Gln) amidotransferase subunit D
MSYSKKIKGLLKKKNITPGDRVIAGKYEGLFMPSPEITSSPDHLILKLDNGYNVGVEYKKGMKIEKSKNKEPKNIQEEFEYESNQKRKQFKEKKGQPLVSIISVGGTIASKVDYRTGAVHAALKARDLVAMVPELGDIADLKMNTISQVMSEDMDPKNWQQMAKQVAKELNSKPRGVVLTHGTDTMHYSSAALSFMLPGLTKPVVLTGSQRSSDRGSSDSSMNLICSVLTAQQDFAEVGVCMHAETDDTYCFFLRGTKVRKMHSTMRNAFRPINDYPLAKVWPDGRVEVLNKEHRKRGKGKVKPDTKFQEKVALVKAHPGADPSVIDFFVKKGFKGIVVEGTALGHVPTQARKTWIPTIKKTVETGVPVVVASQCLYGRTDPNVYSNLRTLYYDAGAMPAGDMLPETAYVKLGWVLGHTKSLKKVREMMAKNYAGELNERLEPGMFLY